MMILRLQFAAATLLLANANTDVSCADGANGDCVPAVSASLLQKALQNSSKATLSQEPSEEAVYPGLRCEGVTAQGRCWYLSELGEACATTCAKYGRSFSYTIADPEKPVTPALVHHEPRVKQEPWAALECYAPSEDRYHPANQNAARHFVEDIGNWSHENCKLACPCGGPADERCGWKLADKCAPKFMWKGVEYNGCATVDLEHERPWCQHNYQHTEKDTNDWSYCSYSCDGELPKEEEKEPAPPPTPAPQEDAKQCSWVPKIGCQETFTYKGVSYTGCTDQDHPVPWCSRNAVHKGEFVECSWVCRDSTNASTQPCDPETLTTAGIDLDFIGRSVTLDEVGYKIVTHVPTADSPMNMKRFVCRVTESIDCKVTSLDSLMAFIPLFRDHSFSLLKYELATLCKSGDQWVVPKVMPVDQNETEIPEEEQESSEDEQVPASNESDNAASNAAANESQNGDVEEKDSAANEIQNEGSEKNE